MTNGQLIERGHVARIAGVRIGFVRGLRRAFEPNRAHVFGADSVVAFALLTFGEAGRRVPNFVQRQVAKRAFGARLVIGQIGQQRRARRLIVRCPAARKRFVNRRIGAAPDGQLGALRFDHVLAVGIDGR